MLYVIKVKLLRIRAAITAIGHTERIRARARSSANSKAVPTIPGMIRLTSTHQFLLLHVTWKLADMGALSWVGT